MTHAAVIGPATTADAEAICSVRDIAWLDSCENYDLGITKEVVRIYLDGQDGELIPKKIQWWTDYIALDESEGATFVARVGQEIVGFGCVQYKDARRWINSAYVLPEVQGKGVGTMLMHRALDWLGRDEDIYLQVVSYNQGAVEFYEHLGFQKTGVPVDDLTKLAEGIFLPAVEMVLAPPPQGIST